MTRTPPEVPRQMGWHVAHAARALVEVGGRAAVQPVGRPWCNSLGWGTKRGIHVTSLERKPLPRGPYSWESCHVRIILHAASDRDRHCKAWGVLRSAGFPGEVGVARPPATLRVAARGGGHDTACASRCSAASSVPYRTVPYIGTECVQSKVVREGGRHLPSSSARWAQRFDQRWHGAASAADT
jgi:hypothetical protein